MKVTYSTTSQCTAVGWLTPQQTKSGKHPYLYSQCQAIHARSMLPCQDTPAVKATYSAKVRSGRGLEVLMSALRKDTVDLGDGVTEFVYEQVGLSISCFSFTKGSKSLMRKRWPARWYPELPHRRRRRRAHLQTIRQALWPKLGYWLLDRTRKHGRCLLGIPQGHRQLCRYRRRPRIRVQVWRLRRPLPPRILPLRRNGKRLSHFCHTYHYCG